MKSSSSDGFNGEFFHTQETESVTILHKLFKRREKVGMVPSVHYMASILFTQTHNKDIRRKKNYRPISIIRKMQALIKIFRKWNIKILRNISQTRWFYAMNAGLIQHS